MFTMRVIEVLLKLNKIGNFESIGQPLDLLCTEHQNTNYLSNYKGCV